MTMTLTMTMTTTMTMALPILMFTSLLLMLSSLLILLIGILDRVLSSLGLPGWFRHAYFEYHAHVRLRFKFAAGLGETRDGGIPQGAL